MKILISIVAVLIALVSALFLLTAIAKLLFAAICQGSCGQNHLAEFLLPAAISLVCGLLAAITYGARDS